MEKTKERWSEAEVYCTAGKIALISLEPDQVRRRASSRLILEIDVSFYKSLCAAAEPERHNAMSTVRDSRNYLHQALLAKFRQRSVDARQHRRRPELDFNPLGLGQCSTANARFFLAL